MTKVISVVIDKGGVGKTTYIVNAAYRTAYALNKRTLLIDLDKSPSTTARFEHSIDAKYKDENGEIKREHTVASFFDPENGNPVPITVDKNLDLIAGFKGLGDMKRTVDAGMQRMYLLSWYFRNLEEIESAYDYIFIDNHNDLETFTDNSIAISDVIVALIDVDLDSMSKLKDVDNHVESLKKIMIEPISQKSYVNARVVKVGNKLDYNTTDSHVFKSVLDELIKNDSSYLGYFYNRTAFKKTKTQNLPLVKVEAEEKMTPKKQEFYNQTWEVFDKITNY